MNHSVFLSIAVIGMLTGCVASPYYGRPVVKSPEGKLVCGVHGTALKSLNGYSFDGCISGTAEFEFAAQCFPNVIGVGFADNYDKYHTLPFTEYTCEECEKAHERIAKLPGWVVRSAARRAQARRDFELERAAEKAKRSGNPGDARLRDGDGWVTRLL